MSQAGDVPSFPSRHAVPFEMVNAAAFTKNKKKMTTLGMIRALKKLPEILEPVEEKMIGLQGRTRRRREGSWTLAYIGYAVSRYADLQPWYDDLIEDESPLWDECGFEVVPSYNLVWRRFAELEDLADAFDEAISLLVLAARRHEPAIGAWLHTDSTMAQSHGQTRHYEGCPCGQTRYGRRRATTDEIIEINHDLVDSGETEIDSGETRTIGELAVTSPTKHKTIHLDTPSGQSRKYQLIESGGHWWISADPDAGLRAYSKKGRATQKHWHGFYVTPVVDHVTGMPITIQLTRADTNESKLYPDTISRAASILGSYPLAVAADKGFSVREVFKWNTEHGIGSVLPYRATVHKPNPTPDPHGRWDVHGIPSCPGCKGGTNYVETVLLPAPTLDEPDKTRPVVRYLCALPTSPACQGVKEISPSHDWTRILPLWRTHPAYQELRTTHKFYERTHATLRKRYIGPDSVTIRPKRMGLACQQLRANAVLLCYWVKLCEMHGWLEAPPRQAMHKTRRRDSKRNRMRSNLQTHRRHLGIYGGNAKQSRRRTTTPRAPG